MVFKQRRDGRRWRFPGRNASPLPGQLRGATIDIAVYANPLVLLFLSWTAGAIIEPRFRRRMDYCVWRLNAFRSLAAYRLLGIHILGRLIGRLRINFNQELRGLKDQRLETLLTVRCAMTSAEIGHWIGFVTMGLLAGAVWTAERNSLLLAATLILNVVGNACLSLLQQYNKLRIDQIVSRKKRTGQSRIADNRKRCPG